MKALFFILIAFLLSSVAAIAQIEESQIQASVTVNPAFSVTPDSISANVLTFSFLEKNLSFQQNIGSNFRIVLGAEGEISSWVSFSAANFTVAPSQIRIVTVFFEIPNTAARTYTGNITANDLRIPVVLTVSDTYKLNSSLDVVPSGIQLGGNVTVFATIGKEAVGKVKDVEGRIPVVATYQVLKGKQVITAFNTTNEVSDVIEESFVIQIPANASSGKYTATVTATHLGKKTTSNDGFFVGKNNAFGNFLAAIFSLFG